MSEYKLIWSDKALYDLEDAYDLMAEKSTESAGKTIGFILEKVDQLLDFPESGPEEPRLTNRKESYRYLVKGHHKIIYKIDRSKVLIIRVFDTCKDPGKMKP